MPLNLAHISLRANERAFLVGGTGSGKSTLSEALVGDFDRRYRGSGGRVLILDSKPRFRGEYLANGKPAARKYRRWNHGPTIAGSIVVSDPSELKLAWLMGATIVIAQDSAHEGGRSAVPMLAACAGEFLKSSRRGKPQLLDVDETMDFFSGNGAPVGGNDALVRTARAGRERGTGALYCSQRTRGIPGQLIEELSKLYLFRLDLRDDVKRLQEMGAPKKMQPPTKNHAFRYWTKDDYNRVWPLNGGAYALDL